MSACKAILTGHSRGLGAAMAVALLARAIPVLGISRGALSGDLAGYAQLNQIQLDLADTQALENWLGSADLANFAADAQQVLLINNAGLVQPIGPNGQLAAADIARAVALNVTAPLMLGNALANQCPDAVDRRILHISSGAARSPYAGWSTYCATKAALDHHARAVQEDAVAGVRIASVAPGVIDTDMQGEIRATDAAQFPLRERFVALKASGGLASAAVAAEKLIAYLLDEHFGEQPVVDIRDLAN